MLGKLRRLKWNVASILKATGRQSLKFESGASLRILVLSETNNISQSQIFPFHFYSSEIYARYRHSLCEISTSRFELNPELAPLGADIVAVQTWFDLTQGRCDRLFGNIKSRYPGAKIAFLDSFAPTDLRLAKILDPYIDLYVKKHVYRDRGKYLESTRGDTNLAEYYGDRYGISQSVVSHKIPSGFMSKLIVGPSFVTSSGMLPIFFDRESSIETAANFDVHARLATGDGWYGMMRSEAIQAIESLSEKVVLSRPGVAYRKYIWELRRSRICFSPFGFGEVCWRDYEAILCGALLIKPDMSHIETVPNIFVPHETYVPVAWDFSDLKEKIDYYLGNEGERKAISNRAFRKLHEYSQGTAFVDQMSPLFAP